MGDLVGIARSLRPWCISCFLYIHDMFDDIDLWPLWVYQNMKALQL